MVAPAVSRIANIGTDGVTVHTTDAGALLNRALTEP
jgi:hypothetical protein